MSGGFWTDEDLTELIRLVKKYPGGSSARWNIIAETMNRSVQEVTFMAAKMKENGYRLPGQNSEQNSEFTTQVQEVVKKEKVKKTAATDNQILVPETNWSQEQQRALESAIIKYRKNATGDRWQKIANCIPEKTKEECLLRYKYLCELVKSQKKSEEEVAAANDAATNKIVETIVEVLPPVKNIENFEDNTTTEKGAKKRSKREERRRRRNMSGDEDSDDPYQYEMN